MENNSQDKINNSDPNDFSDQFAPIWKKYQISQIAFAIFMGLFAIFGYYRGIANYKNLAPFVLILIIWVVVTSLSIKCPRCKNNSIVNFPERIYLKGECPFCHAILIRKNKK